METCAICKQKAASERDSEDTYSITCNQCGCYKITRTALTKISNTMLSDRQKSNISGWLNENKNFVISSNNINMLTNLRTPSFQDRADKLLLFLEKQTEYAGQMLNEDKMWNISSWCINVHELEEILSFLIKTNRISKSSSRSFKITSDGWKHLETLKTINPQSDQCFVAMWFDKSLNKIYDKAIAPGIRDAGYTPHRVDQRDHNRKIDDEIIAQIKRSRILFADFTGHRGGVYYEAGFAQGLNLEVIWSCKEGDIDKLHFDVRQYNCITWTDDNKNNLKDFRKRITDRIAATVGWGPKLTGRNPNPSTKE